MVLCVCVRERESERERQEKAKKKRRRIKPGIYQKEKEKTKCFAPAFNIILSGRSGLTNGGRGGGNLIVGSPKKRERGKVLYK